jgi:hypothetical protein
VRSWCGIDVEFLVAGGLFHWGEDADSRSLVAAVGEGGHSEGGGAVDGRQGVDAGGSQVPPKISAATLGARMPDPLSLRSSQSLPGRMPIE